MVINVTQEHIHKGARHDCMRCPVALAVLETVPGSISVGVRQYDIAVWFPPNRVRPFNTPPAVVRFISRFDQGEPVSPFSFDLPGLEAAL